MSDELKGTPHHIRIPAKFAHVREHYLAGWARGYLKAHDRRKAERERDAKKTSHVDAEYRQHGTAARHCAVCSMYEGPNKCSAVRSPISPAAVCKFFEAAKKPESRLNKRLKTGVDE